MKYLVLILSAIVCVSCCGCFPEDSDDIQRREQEKLMKEGTAQTGMPSIKNFRERKILKDIIELRDQEGLVTYTYVENMVPSVIKGHTALGGKFTYLGQSIGYGLPYATQYTNPERYETQGATLPQADPNGLFSPSSAEGTWILMKNPNGSNTVPIYVESRVLVSPFKLEMD